MGVRKLLNIELKKTFSSMFSSQLQDYKFLSEFIFNKVGISLNTRTVKFSCSNPKSLNCWGGLFCKQYPDELAQLLVFLYKNRSRINSFCEIGSQYGGSFFVIDSFLRSVNPNMGKGTAVDIRFKKQKNWIKYKEHNPQIDFIQIDSKNFKPEQQYDFCFIDGDHSYKGVKRDYILIKKYARIIAFHDIGFYKSVKRIWDSIDGNKIEFFNKDPLFKTKVGIGVVFNSIDEE